jgi:hypothetical protein
VRRYRKIVLFVNLICSDLAALQITVEKTASPALQYDTLNSKTRTATKAVRFLHGTTQN